MIALPQTAPARIALAIALSLLAHAVVLFVPMIDLPKSEVPLPPLLAKLEPLPKVAAPKPKPPRKKVQPKPQPLAAAPDADATDPHVIINDDPVAIDGQNQPAPDETSDIEKATPPPHPLPKHAQLTFFAYMGTSLKVGEAHHRLDIDDEKNYTLEINMNTTGMASLFKSFALNQHSRGTLTGAGLRPEEYHESKNVSGSNQSIEAKFSWPENSLHLSNGKQFPLQPGTQDIISFLYQLSQLPLNQSIVPIYISNGKKLEYYELEVGEEEYVQTNIGRLRALPLHKIHAQGEEGLDIWLGLEYRLLPIKIRQIDREGHNAGEMLISEIRVAEE